MGVEAKAQETGMVSRGCYHTAKSDSDGDFDIEFEKEDVKIGFGFLSVKVPRDKFLLEIGRALMDQVCGEDVVSWAIRQDRKERSSGGKNNGS